MRRIRVFALALGLLAAIVPATAFANTVEVSNESDFVITHFHLSPVDEDSWGPDQLGDQVIGSGDSFSLSGVPCDSYDVKLIDEDGDECVVPGVDICGGDQGWVVTSEDLLECEGY
jgi:hypothetical protein